LPRAIGLLVAAARKACHGGVMTYRRFAADDERVDRHKHSLRFNEVRVEKITLPRPLAMARGDALNLWVKDQLLGSGNQAYWSMFPEPVPDLVEKYDDERVRELEKVAA
jgi:hypothetical protein